MSGKPFDSTSGRAASLKSPWRTQPACVSVKAQAVRDGFNAGWQLAHADALSPIGISTAQPRTFGAVRDFLLSAGWAHGQVIEITHENDAAAIRQAGGLVVHLETARWPHFEGHITSAKRLCHAGDFVLEGAVAPGEYLPRLLTKLTALLP
jgi:hypothetical protein